MTEFELHTLIMASRAEFDNGTVLVFLSNLLFCALALWKQGALDKKASNALIFMCASFAALFIMRTISAIVRFGWLNLELNEIEHMFNPTMPILQIPTVFARAAVVFGSTYVAWVLLRKTRKLEDTQSQ